MFSVGFSKHSKIMATAPQFLKLDEYSQVGGGGGGLRVALSYVVYSSIFVLFLQNISYSRRDVQAVVETVRSQVA
jgi:hypothetical protein